MALGASGRNPGAAAPNVERRVRKFAMTQAQVTQPRAWMSSTAGVLAGGGFAEAIGGAAAVILSIVALSGVMTSILLPVSALCIGVALLFEGGAIASRFRELLREVGSRVELGELGGGLSAEFLGGTLGVILGILALLGVAPAVLMPVAAIIFGGATLVGAAATAAQRFPMAMGTETDERVRDVLRQAITTASALEVLAGLAAIVLGIVGLARVGSSMELSLVAFLVVGGAILLSGTAIGAKMVSAFQH